VHWTSYKQAYESRSILTRRVDNVLHAKVKPYQHKLYSDIRRPNGSNMFDNFTMASFEPISICLPTLQSALDPSGLSSPIPCSINTTVPTLPNLARPEISYSTLDEGISDASGNFILSQEDYEDFRDAVELGTESEIQVVTYLDPKTNLSHSILFNMDAATSFSVFDNGTYFINDTNVAYFGADFAASTVSMVTECIPATKACNIQSASDAKSSNLSIPFHCSDMFSGDIWEPPTDGVEQFKGWHSIFYENTTGVVANTTIQSQHNPFYFNVTAALTSADISVLEYVQDEQVPSGAVVDAGNGRIALGLSCKATIYSVDYSLIDGSFSFFNATVADPRMASIIKAPLQFGFGRYSLYQQAQIGLLLNDNFTVADQMSASFSQIGIALASGAFHTAYSSQQRERYNAILTEVPGYALWFIVVVCFLYVLFGIGIAVAAFTLRCDHECADHQAQLVPTTRLPIFKTLKQMVVKGFEEGKKLDKQLR
jgi:hypothetical protein